MDIQQLTYEQLKNACTIIPSAILNEYLICFSFKTFLDNIEETTSITQFELTVELSPQLEFNPTQRNTIKINFTTSLKIFFTYFIRLNESLSLNQETRLETILHSLKVTYNCLEN